MPLGARRILVERGQSSLLTSLVAYWKLEEGSGTTRVDATGRGNHLDQGNALPGNAAGVQGNALALASASNQFIYRTGTADLGQGNVDFTIASWIYLTNKTNEQFYLSKTAGSGGDEWFIEYYQTGDRLRFSIFSSVNAYNSLDAATFGSPPATTWMFVVCWYVAATRTMFISVNNGAADSLVIASSATPVDRGSPFYLGTYRGGTLSANGRVDETGIWKRVLSAAERAALYNSGVGRTHPFS